MTDNTREIADFFTEATYTPWGMSKVVNNILAAIGAEKVLPPQMFYTYANKGMLFNKKNVDKKVILQHQAIAWTERYIAKHYGNVIESTTEIVEDFNI